MLSKLIYLFVLSISLFADTERVDSVSDGDTIKAGGKTIRILYIDTPEKFGSDKLTRNAREKGITEAQEQRLGVLASQYAHTVLERKVINFTTTKADKYNRILATVNVDGIDYSSQIIAD